MKNFNSRFAKVRSNIRRGRSEEAIELLHSLQDDIQTKLDTLHRIIETKGKACVPIDERKLEILEADGSTHRLTIAPQTGRVTLKIAKQASETVRKELILFANLMQDYEDFNPVTYRGKISFHNGKYQTTLYSESKKFKESFEMESNNEQ